MMPFFTENECKCLFVHPGNLNRAVPLLKQQRELKKRVEDERKREGSCCTFPNKSITFAWYNFFLVFSRPEMDFPFS